MLFAGVNMLNTMGFHMFADTISDAIYNVYEEGKVLTQEIGGNATTTQFTERVIKEIEALRNVR